MASRAMASVTSTPRAMSLMTEILSFGGAPISVRVEFASVKRQCVGGEQIRVEPSQQFGEPALVRRGQHQDSGALRRRELAIVEVIAIEGDERAPQLPRET